MADDLQTGTPDLAAGQAPDTAPDGAAAPAKKTAKKATAKRAAAKKTATKRTTKKAAAPEPAPGDAPGAPGVDSAVDAPADLPSADAPAPARKTATRKAAAKKTTKRAATKKTAAPAEAPDAAAAVAADETTEPPHGDAVAPGGAAAPAVLFQAPEPTTTTTTRRRTRKAAAPTADAPADAPADSGEAADGATSRAAAGAGDETAPAKKATKRTTGKKAAAKKSTTRAAAKKAAADQPAAEADAQPDDEALAEAAAETPGDAGDAAGSAEQGEAHQDDTAEQDEEHDDDGAQEGSGGGRRRRRRGGRRRRRSGDGASGDDDGESSDAGESDTGAGTETDTAGADKGSGPSSDDQTGEASEGGSRRRRRRRRSGDDGGDSGEDTDNTVTKVRSRRSPEDEITAVSGSTRLEAKKQRRREGREAGRRRAPIVSEAEFLARRESVDRVMVIRQRDDLIQIGVLEDRVLVEHYVARESQTSLIGNVYLGRVQNVLPSMEAAFIDIGKGRNAVLYAGEVNWSAWGHKDGQPRKIENVLSSGQTVLVQVTKDPIGHKGARLSSQVSLAGRFLVYVPDGTTSGISRKLPDTERNRLKQLLKEIVPDSAGVIVRTAAEGASEEELTRDVERLKARWEDIEAKAKGNAPQLLYGEPDLTLKVVRDLFTEDFSQLVIQGDDAWDTVQGYVLHVAPDLEERLVRYDPGADGQRGKTDVFAEYRIDEQIAKGLDRKVWLPSGGSLVIDRTEAMTVVDVNTGKFTGSGGNLEETVTKNNLEAAEEIVRQLRLRDIGGIIVVDFIDMVLESNRDLVLRRLVECLGRDRTRHQVAEVTSLGLVQMTRKRIGTGLLESFSENCEHCQGRGVVIHDQPVEPNKGEDDSRRGGRRGKGRGRGDDGGSGGSAEPGGSTEESHGRGRDRNDRRPDRRNEPRQGGEERNDVKAPSPKEVAAMAREHAEQERPADRPSLDAPSAEQQPSAEQRPRVQEPAEQPAEEPAEEHTAAPAAPKVVTRTRRRSASRPAGQPTTVTTDPVLTPATAATTVPTTEPTSEPTSETAVEQADETPAPVAPPKVVTRTRGRRASRPAGPPSGAEGNGHGAGALEGAAAGGLDGDPTAEPGASEVTDEPHVEHVPIKKKGTRKR